MMCQKLHKNVEKKTHFVICIYMKLITQRSHKINNLGSINNRSKQNGMHKSIMYNFTINKTAKHENVASQT